MPSNTGAVLRDKPSGTRWAAAQSASRKVKQLCAREGIHNAGGLALLGGGGRERQTSRATDRTLRSVSLRLRRRMEDQSGHQGRTYGPSPRLQTAVLPGERQAKDDGLIFNPRAHLVVNEQFGELVNTLATEALLRRAWLEIIAHWVQCSRLPILIIRKGDERPPCPPTTTTSSPAAPPLSSPPRPCITVVISAPLYLFQGAQRGGGGVGGAAITSERESLMSSSDCQTLASATTHHHCFHHQNGQKWRCGT